MSSIPSEPSPKEFDAKGFLATLSENPGVYRMLGAEGEVLYVGKAKNLKRRVSSYFNKGGHSPRISLMLQQVANVETTATRSEAEALILENTLIKKLTPKYNILFRDDKSYPYIALTAHAFPRLAYHRGAINAPPKAPQRGALPPGGEETLGAARRASSDKKAKYFGPFPSGYAVRESIQLIQKTFMLRTCEEAVFRNRSRPCLLHQIRRCKAPCVNLISQEDYAQDVRMAELFLRGRHGEVINDLTGKMQAASEAMQFEQAAQWRDQIRALQSVLHKQFVSSTGDEDVDIIAAVAGQDAMCINLAMVRGGQHMGDRAQFPKGSSSGLHGDEAEGLVAFIEQHYLLHPPPSRVLVAYDIAESVAAVFEGADHKVVVSLPRNEMERAWLAMAEKNAQLAIEARRLNAARSGERLESLREALDLADPPARIECFDISHTQGEGTVASCVVCVDGAMKNSEYRRFNISGITPGDDYAAMRQALTRRYEKVAGGEAVAPDLILIDGGKGQHGVAREVFTELGLEHLCSVGVAKGEDRKPGLETLFVHGQEAPLHLPQDNAGFHLIQEIRDEAHRFAVVGHRARRAKARSQSSLENVAGIGPTKRKKLLAHFGGLQGVLAATVEDLCRVDGISRKLAEDIYNELH